MLARFWGPGAGGLSMAEPSAATPPLNVPVA